MKYWKIIIIGTITALGIGIAGGYMILSEENDTSLRYLHKHHQPLLLIREK